jgi:nuclear GTP-binding protein
MRMGEAVLACSMDDCELTSWGRIAMESDDLAPSIPRKRSRSASPTPTALSTATEIDGRGTRLPKRLRKNRDGEVDVHAQKAMGGANPLNRRALKKEAKKARKAGRTTRALPQGGMEVDDGLEGMFMMA